MGVKGASWPSSYNYYYPPSTIESYLYTHVYFASLQPDSDTFKLVVSSENEDIMSSFTSTLRDKDMKSLISIGGKNDESSDIFANMTSSAKNRKAFIDSTIKVARTYKFDGLDLDWEYPKDSAEMGNLDLLLGEWRAAIDLEASGSGISALLLTGAVYYSPEITTDTPYKYPVESISKNMDWVNVMCYDYYGSWTPSKTGAHAALYDPSPDTNVSTKYGLGGWTDAGVSVEKLVMGFPLFGRTWTLEDADLHGIGAAAEGVGRGEDGFMTFSEVQEFNRDQGATRVHDEQTKSTYSYLGTNWISYNDEISAHWIIGYAKYLGLLGYFLMDLHGDTDGKIISRTASEVWDK